MKQENAYKIKLIKLLEILRQDSDVKYQQGKVLLMMRNFRQLGLHLLRREIWKVLKRE